MSMGGNSQLGNIIRRVLKLSHRHPFMLISDYTFYNLSFQAREESSVVSRMMANIAEAFVFTYLGLTMIKSMTTVLSVSFLLLELIFVCTGRIVAIFGLAYLMK